MNIIDEISLQIKDPNTLSALLSNNDYSIALQDFFNQPYSVLRASENLIEALILPNFRVLRGLDVAEEGNAAFILQLLAFSERLGLPTEFEQLYNLSRRKGIIMSSRIHAAALHMLNVKMVSDYKKRLPKLCQLLKVAIEEEEDISGHVEATFINGYVQLIYDNYDHNPEVVEDYRKSLKDVTLDKGYSFLSTPFIEDVLTAKADTAKALHDAIQAIKDNLLNRTIVYDPEKIRRFLIEKGSEYALGIKKIPPSFAKLVTYCKEEYKPIKTDKIFYSLGRGVSVLTDQNQLLAYMYSFGGMHDAKMKAALKTLGTAPHLMDKVSEVYDWGCGQGLASAIFLESFPLASSLVTLIEPSEVALSRGALHVKHFNNKASIRTIEKDINSLVKTDFYTKKGSVKVHLFSNILDVELFSLTHLIELVKESFRGLNYFVCVSPQINAIRTNRINNFVAAFSDMEDFASIAAFNQAKGTWVKGKSWSRCVRVFKVNLG